jgi:preprotein translocase subunit SecE
MNDNKASKVKGFLDGLKTEYNKIIFPTKQDVVRETVSTIVVSFLIGVVIAVLDLIMKTGRGFILK